MLKIGDFSKLGHVTVKALRHYARIGLLRPEWIDRFTGYRYYAVRQLPRLNRILALKELGFSLEQVAHMVDEQVSAEQLRKVLTAKQAELQFRVQAEQKYAVFEHRGSLAALRETYNYIHQVGLSQSGCHHAKGPELEVYDDKFTDFSPDSILYIYIPIE